MSGTPERAARLCISFDNLGEAAEIELGAAPAGAPPAGHFTVERSLPAVLEALAARRLRATFFVEGLNAELYPEALTRIDGDGHEVAYHAWRHESWGELAADEQAENLARGREAFARLGLEPRGLRPPGGLLGAGGTMVPAAAGLEYCSPAGSGAGTVAGLALLPFEWRHVDASCVLPPLGEARRAIAGSEEPVDPGAFAAFLAGELERLAACGGTTTFVLHLSMLDWLGEERLGGLLDLVAELEAGGRLAATTCAAAAADLLADPARHAGGATLDTTSWA